MSNLDRIISTCQTLASEGKQPSVGLLKARLSNKVALPQIIAGLTAYKQNPNQKVAVAEPSNLPREKKNQNLESRVRELELTVSQLQAEIEKLKENN